MNKQLKENGMNMKLWISTGLALGLTAGAAFPSMAADLGSSAAWYLGLSGGESKSRADSSDINTALSNNGLVPLGSSLDNKDTGWKLYLGHQVNPNFAVELGYLDLGKFSFSSSTAGGSLSGDLKTKSGGYIDAVGIMPLSNNFSIFGKLGVYTIKTELSGSGAGGSVSASHRANDWTYGIGAGYDFSRNFGVRVEWERFNNVGNDSTSHKDVDLASLGVVVKF
jgi:OOP family OmpA-OmpF porin